MIANNFHSPIPDTRNLGDDFWSRRTDLVGIDIALEGQLALLRELSSRYGAEFNRFPLLPAKTGTGGPTFHVRNDWYGTVDAEVLHAMIRHLRPARVVEVGSGFSTLIIRDALDANAAEGRAGRLLTIDPYPRWTEAELGGGFDLLKGPVQEVPLETFGELDEGDILFIDSSHILKMGSDVQFEFLEVLPRLRPGVVVHAHDVYLPGPYPRNVVEEYHHFWNEQYLVQAFLAHNSAFELLLMNHLLHLDHPALLRELITSYDGATSGTQPSSLWLRRKVSGEN